MPYDPRDIKQYIERRRSGEEPEPVYARPAPSPPSRSRPRRQPIYKSTLPKKPIPQPDKKPVKKKQEKKTTYKQISQRLNLQTAQVVSSPISSKEKVLYLKKLKQQRQQIKSYQKQGYRVRKTKEGYQFYKTPEQVKQERLQKVRTEFQKQPPAVQFGRAFFTGATMFPETVYSIAASPFTGETTKDVQERLILRESEAYGRVKRKDYVGFAVKDVALSPAMVEVGITLATMGTARAVGPAFRGLSRATARGYRTVSQFVPEESIIAKGLSKTTRTLGQSPISRRAYKYTFKGYRYGKPFVQGTATPKIRYDTFLGIKHVSKKLTLKPKGRVFLSPSEQRFAAKEMSRLYKDGYKWSPYRRALVKKSKVDLVYDITKKEFARPKTGGRPLKGTTYPSAVKTGPTKPLFESEAKGMRVYSKTGEFLGYKKPSLYQKPLPKKWIKKYRPPLLKDTFAQQPLQPTLQIPQRSTKRASSLFRATFTRGMAAPEQLTASPLLFSLAQGLKTTSAFKTFTSELFKPKQVQKQQKEISTITIQKSDVFKGTKQGKTLTSITEPKTVEKTKKAVIIKTPSVTIQKTPSTYAFKTTLKPFPYVPKSKIYGRGRKGVDYGLFSKTKKFRAVKVKSPLKGLKL